MASVSLFELFAFAWLASDRAVEPIKSEKLVLNVVLNARLGEYFCCSIECKYLGETKVNGARQIFPWQIDLKDSRMLKQVLKFQVGEIRKMFCSVLIYQTFLLWNFLES
ncbi:MAG: hypothetical protein CM15mP58_19830 [Burkholderiaceae bacterium]|nr:MAG: hypothetical protein CM15mP58_19830 [Burkholderiaceae bacterium]